MIHKNAKPNKTRKFIKRTAAVLFVAESIGFLLCYTVYHKLNTERDFRRYMRDNHPGILNAFYSFGESFGSTNIRSIDKAHWDRETSQ